MKREAGVAGKFYPADKKELNDYFKSVFEEPEKKYPQIKGLLAPHAGYVFSGRTAAKAYSCLGKADFKTVIIMGTGHTMPLKKCATLKSGAFSTPYGEVEIDSVMTGKLLASGFFEDSPLAHEREHSIEVQLPFLQYLRGNKFKLVPVVANSCDMESLKEAGRAAGALLREPGTLLVISSDLSHYPPQETALISDRALMEAYKIAVANGDLSFFYAANELLLEKFRNEMDTAACGFSPMVAGAEACLAAGCGNFSLVDYTNSGDVSGDVESVVGYAAGVFTGVGEKSGKIALSEEERAELLSYARKSVSYYLKNGRKIPEIKSDVVNFNVPAAVFVTLTRGGELRGCIGTMSPHSLLLDAVCEYAYNAAFRDDRFEPVSPEELGKIRVEISILSPLKKVGSYEEVREKIHGVYVKKGARSGTYLPQVWEHFSGKEDFLSSLCYEKAGLARDAWKEKSTELYVYSVDSLEEEP
ncbi:MAG: hypothetical protein COT17_00540 [Elusimicrobia bacterium CG08_land_8_20_14_0_20_51_18]|nr:MAG: hypothetical protein COT17_00540 [Elusimicrobia bacterium CG08_land_8_20_14_0_20_51_18]